MAISVPSFVGFFPGAYLPANAKVAQITIYCGSTTNYGGLQAVDTGAWVAWCGNAGYSLMTPGLINAKALAYLVTYNGAYAEITGWQ